MRDKLTKFWMQIVVQKLDFNEDIPIYRANTYNVTPLVCPFLSVRKHSTPPAASAAVIPEDSPNEWSEYHDCMKTSKVAD